MTCIVIGIVGCMVRDVDANFMHGANGQGIDG
jgi:hypothetical protein